MRDTGYGIWDMGWGIRDGGYGIWDMGYGMGDTGYGIWDAGPMLRLPGCAGQVRDVGYVMRDLRWDTDNYTRISNPATRISVHT